MKNIISLLFVLLILYSCGGGNNQKKGSAVSEKDLSANPVYQEGLALVAKNKCLTCHNVNEAITGPSYRNVANKYADRPDTIISHLARKIINGGNGVWGDVFMLPQPGISQEDAEAMVKYILLLKE